MDLVTVTTLCALHGSPLLTPCPATLQLARYPAPPPVHRHVDLTPWQTEIKVASQRFAVPRAWIGAVIAAESGGRTTWQGAPIVSAAGAMGLMQLMPRTYRSVRERYGLGADPFDPTDNILAGTAYLRTLYDRYGYPDLFAAYQAGPKRLEAWLEGNKPLPVSTRAYLERLIPGSALAFESDNATGGSATQKTPDAAQNSLAKHAGGALFFVRISAALLPNSTRSSARLSPVSRRVFRSSARRSPRALFVPLTPPQP